MPKIIGGFNLLIINYLCFEVVWDLKDVYDNILAKRQYIGSVCGVFITNEFLKEKG